MESILYKNIELNTDIVQGNILLAKLDGWKENNNDSIFSKKSKLLLPEEFKYHLKWDWLMPLISLVEEMGYAVIINGESCSIPNALIFIIPDENMEKALPEELDEAKRASVWVALVNFVKWLNQHKITNLNK